MKAKIDPGAEHFDEKDRLIIMLGDVNESLKAEVERLREHLEQAHRDVHAGEIKEDVVMDLESRLAKWRNSAKRTDEVSREDKERAKLREERDEARRKNAALRGRNEELEAELRKLRENEEGRQEKGKGDGNDEMLEVYDFSQGVRGKHYRAYREGITIDKGE